MPDGVTQLTKSQISIIRARLKQDGIKTTELAEDLLDHFCVAIEEKMVEGQTFNAALENTFGSLQEDELKATEMKTQELLEGKKTYYPNLLQSFGLLLMTFAISWVASKGVQAISVGIEDLEMRKQWFEQNYLLIIVFSVVPIVGIPIGYTIWRKRQTQINLPIFSFRTVPAYVYGVMLLIGFLSIFWLEPLAVFFPFFQQRREAELLILENFDPLIVVFVIVGLMILLELLFRGVILRGLLMTMTSTKAIFWSSLFYALMMYPYFASMFFFSLLSGWIYWKTRSLYPSIFFIIAIQFVSYATFHFLGYSGKLYFQATLWNYVDHNLLIYLPLVIGSLLLTVGLLYYLNRKLSVESQS